MRYIFYITGKSASGKDSIYKALLEDKELRLNPMVLYTTRPMRDGERFPRPTDPHYSPKWLVPSASTSTL